MNPTARKLVTIVTEAIIENDLVGDLEALGVSGYTITDARGRGHRGTRSAKWEHGASIRVEVICDEELAAKIVAHLQDKFYQKFAMVSFISEVHVLRGDKF